MKKKSVFLVFLLLIVLASCESKYDKCLRYYIDEDGYSCDEAIDQCD